jgi:hypothetical protein
MQDTTDKTLVVIYFEIHSYHSVNAGYMKTAFV